MPQVDDMHSDIESLGTRINAFPVMISLFMKWEKTRKRHWKILMHLQWENPVIQKRSILVTGSPYWFRCVWSGEWRLYRGNQVEHVTDTQSTVLIAGSLSSRSSTEEEGAGAKKQLERPRRNAFICESILILDQKLGVWKTRIRADSWEQWLNQAFKSNLVRIWRYCC